MSFKEDFKNEFSKKRAAFGDCTPAMMYKSKFGDVMLPVLLYRLMAFIFSMTMWSIYTAPSGGSFIYYTIWSFMVLILYFLMATIVSFTQLPKEIKRRRAKKRVSAAEGQQMEQKDVESKPEEIEEEKEEETIPWYMKIQWILYNVALPTSFLVTIIYWGLLYALFAPETITFFNISVHALNTVMMMIEQYVAAIPTRLLHVYYPVIYAFIYVLFSVIIFYVNGTILYPIVLDWTSPGVTVGVIFGLCLFYFVAQFVLFVIYRALRRCLNPQK